ncbi:hypothetical protein BS78_02G061300 [Paspalum vaginatum]|nr:hypothetical protein BS78_02G061300 [Paspalum vaginatum]
MALQATEQGSSPPASAAGTADPDPDRRPLALGGTGCPKTSAVAGLPDDALVEILSRLPAKFLCRWKCVSKAWCDLIADRLRCRKLPHGLEGFFYGCDVVGSGFFDFDSCSMDSNDDGGSEYDDGEGSGNDYGGGSEDDCKGDGEEGHRESSEDDYEGSSGDGSECGWIEYKPKTHRVHGHFVNLSGRHVPLVDPLFSYLRKQPGVRNLSLLDSCNGLLLFGHTWDSDYFFGATSYIVYNPATEHWVPVPSSGFTSSTLEDEDSDDDVEGVGVSTCLIFDPATSLHFELVEFCHNSKVGVVHTYSSETNTWVDRLNERWEAEAGWDFRRTIRSKRGSTIFKKMLHFIVSPFSIDPGLIAAIDGTGKVCRVIHWVNNHGSLVFVGHSKGLLHCLSVTGHPDGNSCHMTELSIWVLEDYDTEDWNLKHTVSFSQLFGKESCQFGSDYNVVIMHPDRNVVFFLQHWDNKLVSYDLDRKEVCVLCSVKCHYGIINPYVPYFSEMPVLSNKH